MRQRFVSAAVLLVLAWAAGPAVAQAPGAAAPADAPALDGPRNVALPATADGVTPAGGGRYLLLRLDKIAKLAVYDVAADRIKGYIPLASTDTLVAGGADRVVLIAREKNVIQRWKLDPIEKELTVALVVGQVDGLAMGHASHGPVLVMTRTGPQFFSLQTLKPLDLALPNNGNIGHWVHHSDSGLTVAASPDGQTFAGYSRHSSPSGLRLLRVQGNSVVVRYEHNGAGALLPGWDGSQIFTGNGIFSSDLKPLSQEQFRQKVCIPAYRPGYFLTVNWADPHRNQNQNAAKPGTPVSVYTSSDRALLVTLPPMPELTVPRDGYNMWQPGTLEWHERLFLIPQHKRLITVADTRDQLVVRPFDMMATLDKAGIDYLFVDSLPVTAADPGRAYRYPMTVQSKKGGVKYSLDSGPQGMTISKEGVLGWQVPNDHDAGPVGIIVTVEDAAGQSIFHTFNVQVSERTGLGVQAKKINLGPESNQYNPSGSRGAPPVVRAVKKPAKNTSSAKTE